MFQTTSRSVVPNGTSIKPVLATWPVSAKVLVPGEADERHRGGPSFVKGQVAQSHHRGQKVQRGWQPAAGREIITPAIGKEVQHGAAAQLGRHAGAATEIDEIRAAAHGHMRRKIDELPHTDVVIGSGPAARRGRLFEQFDVEPSLHRRHGCCQSGETAADNGQRRFLLVRGEGSGGHVEWRLGTTESK